MEDAKKPGIQQPADGNPAANAAAEGHACSCHLPHAEIDTLEIPDEETPLAPPPKEEEIEIDDEDVPLANLPKTGGLAGIPMGLFGLMAIGGGIFLKKKNQDEE